MNQALKMFVLIATCLSHSVATLGQEAAEPSQVVETIKSCDAPIFEYVSASIPQEGLTDFEQYLFAGITRITRELERGASLSALTDSRIFGYACRTRENPYYPRPYFCRAPWRMNFELGYQDSRSSVASDITIAYDGLIITLSKKDDVCGGTMKYRCGYDYDAIGRFDFHPNGMLRSLQYTRVKYLGYSLMSSVDLSKYGEVSPGQFESFVEALNKSILSGDESRDLFTRGVDTNLFPSKSVQWDDQGKIVEYTDCASSRGANALEFDFPISEGDKYEINPFHNTRDRANKQVPLSLIAPFETKESFDIFPTVSIPTENLNEHDRQKAELITQLTRIVSRSKTIRELRNQLAEFPFDRLFEAEPATPSSTQPDTLVVNFLGNTEKSPCEFLYESRLGRFSIRYSFSAPNSKPDDYILIEVLNADGKSGCTVNALSSGVATDLFFHSGKEPLIAPLVFQKQIGMSDEEWKEYQEGYAPLCKMYEDSFASLGLNDVRVNYVNNDQEKTRVVKHVKWNDSGEYLGQISWSQPVTYLSSRSGFFKEKTPRFFAADSVGYGSQIKANKTFYVYYGDGKAIVFGSNPDEPLVYSTPDSEPIDVDAPDPETSFEVIPVNRAPFLAPVVE